MPCQSNKLQSFTVRQEFGKIAQRSYSYSTCLAYEQGSRKAFLITVAEEENMSQTSLCCNLTQDSHTQLHHTWTIESACYFSCCGWHIKPCTISQSNIWTRKLSVYSGKCAYCCCDSSKTIHAFFVSYTQLLMLDASWNSFCANSGHFSGYDMWHARYIYIGCEACTNIGKQVVWAEQQMLYCMAKPLAADMV